MNSYLCDVKKVARFLVRYRVVLLAVMVVLAVVGGLMVPRIRINSDMTLYLPDDSPMKRGIDRMAEDFPQIDTRMRSLDVMFTEPVDLEEVQAELAVLTGGLTVSSLREAPPYTLIQYTVTNEVDPFALQETVEKTYGDRVVVEITGEDKMPPDLVPILMLGVGLAFLILLIMCSSVMEALLFIVTMGIAVALNMGTNALLPHVSMITNSLAAVLQLVLSMDFSIIIMNRYRQEKSRCPDSVSAMEGALVRAAPSVLSSALTTIVSLLMLVFMRFKIGADIGIVLSKGVFFSLVCNFTVLPALILMSQRAIAATGKKVPVLPAARLARFEMKYRIPLAILFVALFVSTIVLQRRTVISFSAIWPNEITVKFPPQNPVMLLYDTNDEAAVPALLDSLSEDPLVATCVSYPGMVLEGYTVPEMTERFAAFSPMLTEDLLRIVYYARSHPGRTERFSLQELQDVAGSLSGQGLLPEDMDVASLADQLLAEPSEKPVQKPKPAKPVPDPEPMAESEAPADTLSFTTDSLAAAPVILPEPVLPPDSAAVEIPAGRFTYEEATQQRTSRQIAELVGIGRTQASLIFRMAGRTGKGASGTMSLYEFVRYVNSDVRTDKRYASFISKSQASELDLTMRQLDSAVAAGPVMPRVESVVPEPAAADSLQTFVPADSTAVSQTDSVDSIGLAPVKPIPEEPVVEEPEPEPTPLEKLAEMAFSGQRYSAAQTGRALRAAGIPVQQSDVDLLFLYAGSQRDFDPEQRMSVSELVNYLSDTLLVDPAFGRFVDDSAKEQISDARQMLGEQVGALRSERSSIAAVITDYERESPGTFAFIDRLRALSDRELPGEHYLIGESVMFEELRDGFPSELLLLTLLTVISIFLIVALTFRSPVIPVFLIITVLSGVYINVFASGLGGNRLFFLAYLIVQGILMGAIIDYSILLTSYYRESRRQNDILTALTDAYRGAGHSILTSGLIIVLTPFLMFATISDQMIAMILKGLGIGALSAILIILLVLPGVLAVCDRFVKKRIKP